MATLNFGTQLELNTDYDVIVVGGGPAGCTAATAAAREGAKTLLIEATGILGGMATSGLVPTWCPFTDKEKIIYGGLAETVLRQGMAGTPHVPPTQFDWTPIDPEQVKRVFDELVSSHGADILFNSQLCAVEAKNGRVEAIIVANKAGLTAYRAKVYVDTTGDGDLCARAGAEVLKGAEGGKLQPATHCFVLTNVDEYAFHSGPWLHGSNPASPIHAILASGKYPLITDSHCCQSKIGPRAIGFNAGHLWDVDNTDPLSASRALIRGRKMAREFQLALAEFFPKAFANAWLAMTGSMLGVRETRRIVGDYLLRAEELMAFASFPDEICRNCYYIDVHLSPSEKTGGNPVHGYRFPPGRNHGIPYRCLTPKGLTNVLVAGRAISTDRPTNGSVRVMPVCLATGEAAGLAATLAMSRDDRDVHQIEVGELRRRLQARGAFLPDTP